MSRPRIASFVGLTVATVAVLSPVRAQDGAPPGPPPPAPNPKLDGLTGFRGKKFGAPLSEFSGLQIEQDRGALKIYVAKTPDLALGPGKLEQVLYYFFNDKLMAVGLHTDDGRDSSILLRVLDTAFGPGGQPDPALPNYYWQGKTANVRYHLNPGTGEAEAVLADNASSKAYEDYEAKAVADAASEL